MFKLILFVAVVAISAEGWAQTFLTVTPYTRGLMTNRTASETREYLGIDSGSILGSIATSPPLVSDSGEIYIPRADSISDGFLGASDWTVFNEKLDSNAGTGTNNVFYRPTNFNVTIWATNASPTLQMLGDFRNGVDGERYSTVFAGDGNPAMTLNGWITMSGNTNIGTITRDKSYMFAMGMDVPFGFISYGAGEPFTHYSQILSGLPTNAAYPTGAVSFAVGGRGNLRLINIDGAGYPFPQLMIQANDDNGALSNSFGIYAARDNLLKIGPADGNTNIFKGITIKTNGNVAIGATNAANDGHEFDLKVLGTSWAYHMMSPKISANHPGINTTPANQSLWVSGQDAPPSGEIRGRMGIGATVNQDYSTYWGAINHNNGNLITGQLGTRSGGTDQPAITMQGGRVTIGATNLPTVALDVYGAGKFSGAVSVAEPTKPDHAATVNYVNNALARAADEILSTVDTGTIASLLSNAATRPVNGKLILYTNDVLAATGVTNYTIDFHHTNAAWPVIRLENENAKFTFINLAPGRSTTVFLDALTNTVGSTLTWPDGVITNVNNTGVVPDGYLKVINLYVYNGTNSSDVMVTEGALNKR